MAGRAGQRVGARHGLVDVIGDPGLPGGPGLTRALHGCRDAVLSNGLGRYDEALDAAERGTGYPCELGLAARSTAELIEAAARAAAPGRSAGATAAPTPASSFGRPTRC